jgi:hypothetical protein
MREYKDTIRSNDNGILIMAIKTNVLKTFGKMHWIIITIFKY